MGDLDTQEPPHCPGLWVPGISMQGKLLQSMAEGWQHRSQLRVHACPGHQLCSHPNCPFWKRFLYSRQCLRPPTSQPLAERMTIRFQRVAAGPTATWPPPRCPGNKERAALSTGQVAHTCQGLCLLHTISGVFITSNKVILFLFLCVYSLLYR